MMARRISLKHFMVAAGMVMVVVFSAQAAVDPVTVEVHYQNGVKYFKRGLYDKSIQEFEKTLSLDPGHPEARAYLVKVRAFEKQRNPVLPDVDKENELRSLNEEGRSLYRKGDYAGARDKFSKVLEIKRVDDFASYYRERCEIYIARQLAHEKKAAARTRAKEKGREERLDKIEALAEKRSDKKRISAKRAVIQEERRSAAQARVGAVTSVAQEAVAAESDQKVVTFAQKKGQEKDRVAEEKRQAGSERREAKIQARDEKIRLKAEKEARMRQEKAAGREARIVEKEQFSIQKNARKQTEAEAHEERRRLKELFIKGVEQYGKKNYEGAIAVFDELMEKERQSGLVYTSTSRRLKAKAEERLKGTGEDKEI